MTGRFVLAVVLCSIVFAILLQVLVFSGISPKATYIGAYSLREALWSLRTLDVIGQLALLFTATYGVLALAKENR
jgi:hypothetical protein